MNAYRHGLKFLFLLAAWVLPPAGGAAAATTTHVVDLPLPSGAIQRILDVRPEAPIATIVGLPGGPGILGIGADGSIALTCYPPFRIRGELAAQGIAVVLVDQASDGTVWGVDNISTVIAWARRQADVPVWISGGSASTISAATIVNVQPDTDRVGALFFSPGKPIRSAVGRITRPTLVAYNRADGLQWAEPFYAALTSTSVKALVGLPGTTNGGCTAHLFEGLDHELASTISTFIHEHNASTGGAGFDNNQAGLSGSWADPTTDGQGFVLDVVPDFLGAGRALLFGGWFTYDIASGGGLRWYTLQGELAPSGPSSMAIFQTLGGTFASGQATQTEPAGTVSVAFHDCSHASLDYRFDDGREGSLDLVRLLGNVTCSATGQAVPPARSAAWSGAWADPAHSGQGFVLEFNPDQELMFGAWYTFEANAAPGAGGQDWYTLQAAAPRGANRLEDIGIYATEGGVFDRRATTRTSRVGSVTLTLHDCSTATLEYRYTGGRHAGASGILALSRITPPARDCQLWP